MSFLVQLLPYVEQFGIANHFDNEAGAYAAKNAPAREKVIPTYVCPSSFLTTNNDGTAGLSNYAGCHHGSETPIDKDNNGVLFLNSEIRYGEITDGGCNTILVGEFLPLDTSLGWASGTRATLRNTGELVDVSYLWKQERNDGLHEEPEVEIVGGFGSYHPGGAQFVLAGGGVTFLRQSIDPKLFNNLGNRKDGEMMGDF